MPETASPDGTCRASALSSDRDVKTSKQPSMRNLCGSCIYEIACSVVTDLPTSVAYLPNFDQSAQVERMHVKSCAAADQQPMFLQFIDQTMLVLTATSSLDECCACCDVGTANFTVSVVLGFYSLLDTRQLKA